MIDVADDPVAPADPAAPVELVVLVGPVVPPEPVLVVALIGPSWDTPPPMKEITSDGVAPRPLTQNRNSHELCALPAKAHAVVDAVTWTNPLAEPRQTRSKGPTCVTAALQVTSTRGVPDVPASAREYGATTAVASKIATPSDAANLPEREYFVRSTVPTPRPMIPPDNTHLPPTESALPLERIDEPTCITKTAETHRSATSGVLSRSFPRVLFGLPCSVMSVGHGRSLPSAEKSRPSWSV